MLIFITPANCSMSTPDRRDPMRRSGVAGRPSLAGAAAVMSRQLST
jgi:hypothetical protein